MNTYAETLEYLYTRLPMFSRVGASAYKADLHNIRKLCSAIGDPQTKFRAIHIAGTNGKGSVSHMLASILQCAGYKTGLYTSPHLRDFRERIRVNGEMIPQHAVVEFTRNIRELIEEIEPSFFEITVAMAFRWFEEAGCEIVVIETGLGGRLDSTNIINPDLAVITNIGYDHMNILGDSLHQIALEKAGIIKPNRPVVLGESREVRSVFEEVASANRAPLTVAEDLWKAYNWEWKDGGLEVEMVDPQDQHHHYLLDLQGLYQLRNLATVLEACRQLKKSGWRIDEKHVRTALSQVKKLTGLHGRWEKIRKSPTVILDVAHNPDGIRQLLDQVEVTAHDQLRIVIGLVKDKDIAGVLSLLPVTARYYFTQAQIPRAMPAENLLEEANRFFLPGNAYANVNAALDAAISESGERDLVIVCGSVFLVSEVN